MQETRVQFLSQDDPLEMEMAAHPSIFAWKNLTDKEPGRLHSMRLQRAAHTEQLNHHCHHKTLKLTLFK